MSEKINRISVGFRIQPTIWEKFIENVHNESKHGGIAFILEKLITSYNDSFFKIGYKDELSKFPNMFQDFETVIKPAIKQLKLNVDLTVDNSQLIHSGPLQDFIRNTEDANIYARALRVRWGLYNMDLEAQVRTKMTLEEAYELIYKHEAEKLLSQRISEKRFDIRVGNGE